MPYARNGDTRIYFESEGSGPPIVMMHGMWGSLDDWFEAGYVEQLCPQFTLVMFEARGHGASDRPHDPAQYSFECLASDVLAVVEASGAKHPVYWGYSYGARLGYGLGWRHPDNFKALILGGNRAVAIPESRISELVQIANSGRESLGSTVTSVVGPASGRFGHRWMSGDLKAYSAAAAGLATLPDVSALLPAFALPCLLYAGDLDPTAHAGGIEASRSVREGRFVSLTGLDHIQGLIRSDLIVPHVREFMARLGE